MTTTKTLAELRAIVKKERRWVDIKPYSHNIISITLLLIAKNFGYDQANKAVLDFNLKPLGWKTHKDPKKQR